MAYLFWFIAAIALVVVELLTVDLVFAMLSAGAAAAGIASLFLDSSSYATWIEIGVFAAVSILLLLLVRPWFKKRLALTQPQVTTNVYALHGQPVTVLRTVTDTAGQVRLSGEVWSARTQEKHEILPGTAAWVSEISGATAMVVTQAPNIEKTN